MIILFIHFCSWERFAVQNWAECVELWFM